MSKRLTEEEKRERKLIREAKKAEADLSKELDDRCFEILLLLRNAEPDVKYNSKYFEKHFQMGSVFLCSVSVCYHNGRKGNTNVRKAE